jgi:tripartite-type tricarboxylate transporter receptor subunit TctC
VNLARVAVRVRIASPVAAMVCACFAASAAAQQPAYPSKPVTVIIPFTPGSSQETEGRVHMNRLAEQLGQPFVIDFKPGGATIIGLGYVAKQPADGYTLLLVSASYSLIPLRSEQMTFDKHNAFTPVSLISKRWGLIVVHPSMPSNVADFVAYAKANPGKINFGTSGATGAGHLSMQLLHQITGTKVTFIHYKGGGPTQTAVMSGEVDVIISSVISTKGIIKAGKAKLIAMLSAQRTPVYPDVATMGETVPGWEYPAWLGIGAPATTPPAILNRMNAELVKVAKDPVLAEKLADDASFMIGNSRQEFTQFVNGEAARWAKLVKDLGIKLEP